MELTGKCKKDFEKWYEEKYIPYQIQREDYILEVIIPDFEVLPISMRFGIIADFSDTTSYAVDILVTGDGYFQGYVDSNMWNTEKFNNRDFVRIETTRKFNELYNLNN